MGQPRDEIVSALTWLCEPPLREWLPNPKAQVQLEANCNV
jgi:hypothetical protein